jgi:hypothetical protein
VTGINKELAERIKGEMLDLEQLVDRIMRAWPNVGKSADEQDVYLDSVSLNLHGFYSGLERLFELVASRVDRVRPSGETWHRDLLVQMANDYSGVRPAVIDRNSAVTLDEFRRFRHLVRNIYTLNLVPEKVERLVSALPELWKRLSSELSAFADFLEQMADEEK